MPRNVFQGLKIAVHGHFGEDWRKERFARYITNNGGEMVNIQTEGVTHLITTIKAYESNSVPVQKAEELGIHLVHFDWFEDSLRDHQKKRESKYSIKQTAEDRLKQKEKRKRKRDEYVEAEVAEFNKGVNEARANLKMEGYMIYVDPTGFKYDIRLTRKGRSHNKVEFVDLRLFTTFGPPHAFACSSIYTSHMGYTACVVEAGAQSQFEDAFKAFRKCFKDRARKDWEDRCDGKLVLLENGRPDPVAYTYSPPKEGPVGMAGAVVLDDEGYLAAVERQKYRFPLPIREKAVGNGSDEQVEEENAAEAETEVEMEIDNSFDTNTSTMLPSIEMDPEVEAEEMDESGHENKEHEEPVITYAGKGGMPFGIVQGHWGGVTQ